MTGIYIGCMRSYIGNVLYWDYTWRMESKMEATIWGLGVTVNDDKCMRRSTLMIPIPKRMVSTCIRG